MGVNTRNPFDPWLHSPAVQGRPSTPTGPRGGGAPIGGQRERISIAERLGVVGWCPQAVIDPPAPTPPRGSVAAAAAAAAAGTGTPTGGPSSSELAHRVLELVRRGDLPAAVRAASLQQLVCDERTPAHRAIFPDRAAGAERFSTVNKTLGGGAPAAADHEAPQQRQSGLGATGAERRAGSDRQASSEAGGAGEVVIRERAEAARAVPATNVPAKQLAADPEEARHSTGADKQPKQLATGVATSRKLPELQQRLQALESDTGVNFTSSEEEEQEAAQEEAAAAAVPEPEPEAAAAVAQTQEGTVLVRSPPPSPEPEPQPQSEPQP
jgi:hypothetical protein